MSSHEQMWESIVARFEARASGLADQNPAVVALWAGGLAAAQTLVEGDPEISGTLEGMPNLPYEHIQHIFARRMVCRFNALAASQGAQLSEADIARWYALVDEACAMQPESIEADRRLDAQFEHWFPTRNTSFGVYDLEPSLVFSFALEAIGAGDLPFIPEGSLPADSFTQFLARGRGVTTDIARTALAADALLVGMNSMAAALRVVVSARNE